MAYVSADAKRLTGETGTDAESADAEDGHE